MGIAKNKKTVKNGLEGPILTHKVDSKCSDINLSESDMILEAKIPIWGLIYPNYDPGGTPVGIANEQKLTKMVRKVQF